MADNINDIRDDEFRVIGKPSSPVFNDHGKRKKSFNLFIIIILSVLFAFGILALILWPKEKMEETDEGIFEDYPEVVESHQLPTPFGIDTNLSFTEKIDTVINDVVLSVYVPHNAMPELTLGLPDCNDKSIILSAQAADIRKDNRQILGAFVLRGEPLAWGVSKKGYCAIIDDIVTIGVSENSPLFEEATEKGGYFFRQYPLVDNGAIVENEPKNKTMRKALCARAGQVFVAVSETDESFHDFSQALVDLGVENAIYLVGSYSSFGWYIGSDGQRILFAPNVHRGIYMNENYIIWRQRTVL